MAKEKISVVFASSASFAVPVLRALKNDPNIEVKLVLSNPPRPVGRKQVLTKTAIHELADQLGIPVATPDSKKALTEFVEATNFRPDFLIVIAYGLIVQKAVLDWPLQAAVNSHLSILPKYRGASPVQSALLNNEAVTGNTYIKMDEGMDTGDVYKISEIPISPDTVAGELTDKHAELTAKELPDLLQEIKSGLTPKVQVGEPSICRKIKKSDGELKFNELTAQEIINRFRAYYPWPGVFFIDENGLRHLVKEIIFVPKEKDFDCSTNFCLQDKVLWVACKENYLGIKLLQPAGKSPLSASEWYNGYIATKNK